MKNRCLFLDRDGVINYDFGYVYLEKDFRYDDEFIKQIKEQILVLAFLLILLMGIGYLINTLILKTV